MRALPPPCPACLDEPPGLLVDVELPPGACWWHICGARQPWVYMDAAKPSPQLWDEGRVVAARPAGAARSLPRWLRWLLLPPTGL